MNDGESDRARRRRSLCSRSIAVHLNGRARRWSVGFLSVVLSVLSVASVGFAAGKSVRYRGIHPLPPHSGQFCYIEALHVHAAAPSDMRAYRVLANREHLFVGDEAALGYDGPKHAYFGPHPMRLPDVAATEKVFCYLRGAHFHARAPEAADSFASKDGVFWFTGTFPPDFERDRFNVWVNDMRPVASYHPPAVTISAAPVGYRLPEAVALPERAAILPAPPAAASAATKPGALEKKKVVMPNKPVKAAEKPASAKATP